MKYKYSRKIQKFCACGKSISRSNSSGKCWDCYLKSRDNYKKDFIGMMKRGEIKVLYSEAKKNIKKYFLSKQNYCCDICGIKNIWNGKELMFILDHIDGNVCNNNESNFRLICSNCDSQLDTYKSKNKNGGREYDKKYRLNKYHKNKIK